MTVIMIREIPPQTLIVNDDVRFCGRECEGMISSLYHQILAIIGLARDLLNGNKTAIKPSINGH